MALSLTRVPIGRNRVDCVHVAWKMRARDTGRALGKEKARLVPANLPCFGTVFKRAAFELDYRRPVSRIKASSFRQACLASCSKAPNRFWRVGAHGSSPRRSLRGDFQKLAHKNSLLGVLDTAKIVRVH